MDRGPGTGSGASEGRSGSVTPTMIPLYGGGRHPNGPPSEVSAPGGNRLRLGREGPPLGDRGEEGRLVNSGWLNA